MSEASFSEQLISAYVDGQLTGDELAQAEKLITENPHLAELAEQWRAQGQQISELPRFQLDAGFAERVLAAAKENRAANANAKQANTIPSSPKTLPSIPGGRSAFVSIVALAAMLLLTLFVFPKFFVNNNAGVAQVGQENAENVDKVDNNENRAKDAQADSDQNISNEVASDEVSNKPDNGGASLPPQANADSKQAASADANQPTNAITSNDNNVAPQIAQSQSGGGQQRRMAPESNDVNPASPIEMKFLEGGKNVDQFILVELEEGESLQQFEEVLVKNRIQFAKSGGKSANLLKSKMASDIEMLHVYSSPSQMVGAINELSQNNLAKIQGYRIPSRSDYMVASNSGAAEMSAMRQSSPPMKLSNDGGGRGQAGADMVQADPMKKESQHISPPSGFGMKVQPSMRISRNANAAKNADLEKQKRVVETDSSMEEGSLQSGQDQVEGDKDLSRINEWFGLDRNLGQPTEKMQQYLLLIKVKSKASTESSGSSQPEKSDK